MTRHLLALSDFNRQEILKLIDSAIEIKKNPQKYSEHLKGKTLLMLFEKPSLRTRISFEVGMTQLGGHAIFYSIQDSPLGKKENIADTARCAARFVDIIMARVNKRQDMRDFAKYSSAPVINALDDFAHPCQILGDLLTMKEKGRNLEKMKLAYFGDGHNNVTYDLMRAAGLLGFEISVACPAGEGYAPEKEVSDEANKLAKKSGAKITITHKVDDAARSADVIYTDSWMSYHIPKEKEAERVNIFRPYQVTKQIMGLAKPDAVFMNCLPAQRGYEQTAEVIDGAQSIVFDQAENRLHIQKAIMLFLLNKI